MDEKTYISDEIITSQFREIEIGIDELRNRRRALMYRLHNAGLSHDKIGKIYGCRRQFVQQEIATYKGQQS